VEAARSPCGMNGIEAPARGANDGSGLLARMLLDATNMHLVHRRAMWSRWYYVASLTQRRRII